MRQILSVFVIFFFLFVSACAEEAPECDLEEEATCTCSDSGLPGTLECNDEGGVDCICDDDDENDENAGDGE